MLFYFDQTTNFEDKLLFSQILVNMCLAHEREAKKLVKSGIIKSLIKELNETSGQTLAVKINCIWALSNLAGSSVDIKQRILDEDENIF